MTSGNKFEPGETAAQQSADNSPATNSPATATNSPATQTAPPSTPATGGEAPLKQVARRQVLHQITKHRPAQPSDRDVPRPRVRNGIVGSSPASYARPRRPTARTSIRPVGRTDSSGRPQRLAALVRARPGPPA